MIKVCINVMVHAMLIIRMYTNILSYIEKDYNILYIHTSE